MTLPPTVNWLDEMVTPSSKWQLMPPIITGRMPIVTPFSRPEQAVAVQPGGTTTTQAEKAEALPQRPPVRLASPQGHACRQPNRVNRRRAVTLIVSGTATAGVLAVSYLSKETRKALADAFHKLATRGRKQGLTPLLYTQSISEVAKSAIRQASRC